MTSHLIVAATRIVTGVRPRWLGCAPESDRVRIYFANHTSNLDFVVMWAALSEKQRRRTRPVAARDYWTGSKLRLSLAEKVFRAVLIERKKVTRENNPLELMENAIAAGDSLIIFPEGGRFEGVEPGPFKGGLFHLAQRHPEAEFVPCFLENLNRVLPKGEALFIPVLCSVSFGTPVSLAAGETKELFLERARQAVIALHHP